MAMPYVLAEHLRRPEQRRFRLLFAATVGLVFAMLLASVKPFLEYEWYGWEMVCRSSGPFPNQGYSEPTIRDRLGASGARFDPAYPRLYFMPMIDISEIVDVGPSIFLNQCWFITTTHDHYHVPLYYDCELGPPGGPEVDRVVA